MLLDYLRVRLPDDITTWAELRSWLGVMTDRGFGWRGWYDVSYSVLDGGIVARCTDPARAEVEGVLVDLPGRACACLGDRLTDFLRFCCRLGRVTRADWAIDDRAGRLTLDRIRQADASGGIVSRWHSPLSFVERRYRGVLKGWTVYIGQRSCEAFVRIYDKAAEQGVTGVDWVRFELETKGKTADALSRAVLEQGNSAVLGQINRRIRFIEPSDTDSNRWRNTQGLAGWWVSFMGDVQPGSSLLSGEKPVATVERMVAVVERQASAALATIVQADGGSLDRVEGIIRRGATRMRARHFAALEWAMSSSSLTDGG